MQGNLFPVHFGERYDAQLLIGQDLRGHTFIQCTFNHVHIAPTQDLYGATFYGCTAMALEAQNVTFRHVTAKDCDFRHSNFKGAVFHQSMLHKCDFTWATFKDADLGMCSCTGSNFDISRIQKAKRLNPYDRDVISELIRSNANGDVEVMQIAALVKNSMDFCWNEWEVYAEMPQWKRVGRVIKKILMQYADMLNVSSEIMNHSG